MLNSGLAYKSTPSLHHSVIDSKSSGGDLWIYFRLRITSNTFFLAARHKHENKLIPFILILPNSAVTIINNITVIHTWLCVCVCVCVCVCPDAYSNWPTDWLAVIWRVRTCCANHSRLPNHALCVPAMAAWGNAKLEPAARSEESPPGLEDSGWDRPPGSGSRCPCDLRHCLLLSGLFTRCLTTSSCSERVKWWSQAPSPGRVTGLIPAETTHVGEILQGPSERDDALNLNPSRLYLKSQSFCCRFTSIHEEAHRKTTEPPRDELTLESSVVNVRGGLLLC